MKMIYFKYYCPIIVTLIFRLLSIHSFSASFHHGNADALSVLCLKNLGRTTKVTGRNVTVMKMARPDRKHIDRRFLLQSSSRFATLVPVTFPIIANALTSPPSPKQKCTDIESCREIGNLKIEQKDLENPIVRLDQGVRYKMLQAGTGNESVQKGSNLDLIFSISTASGQYMYSRGFGFEKIDLGDGQLQKDTNIDSLRVMVGERDVPLGIEWALLGMKKGERRRVELPPVVGFETSEWKPHPNTRRGKASISSYKKILEGFGSQPAFPAETIWDIEVLRIRS